MYNPFSKGRWYRFFIKSTGTAFNLTTSDIEGAAIENNSLLLPVGYRVIDVVTDINSIASASDEVYGYKVITGDGRQGYFLPNTELFDYGFIYVFARHANGAVSTPGQDETVIPGGWQEPGEGTVPGGWQEPVPEG